MKVIVAGLGIQGLKRVKIVGNDLVCTVDPYKKNANFSSINQVPLELYDAAILAVPEETKYDLIKYLLSNSKHILVEKPLLLTSLEKFSEIQNLAKEKNVFVYSAYNHRFEPQIQRVKKLLENKVLGRVYSCNLFYGNGTAKLVKESPWRDQKSGVLSDLGSHLFDLVDFWFDAKKIDKVQSRLSNFENLSPDNAELLFEMSGIHFNLKMTYCSWKNNFSCEIIGENGSLNINGLCKWGNSELVHSIRKLPSGKPREKKIIEFENNETLNMEYNYFKNMVNLNAQTSLVKDRWIFSNIMEIYKGYDN